MHQNFIERHLMTLSGQSPLELTVPVDLAADLPVAPLSGRIGSGESSELSTNVRTILGMLAASLKLLDRPGGRTVLSWLGTIHARMGTSPDPTAEIMHDGEHWIYRSDKGILVQDSFTWHLRVAHELAIFQEYYFNQASELTGQTIVHVGAGTGADILLASRVVGPTGKVIAIEGHPKTFACLQSCCRYNNLSNVTPIEIAISDKEGQVAFDSELSTVSNSIVSGKGVVSVPCTTLDRLLSELKVNSIGLLLMNIEGAECLALAGMSNMIQRVRQAVVCCHDFRAECGNGPEYATRLRVEEYFSYKGFNTRRMEQHPEAWVRDHLYAERRFCY